MADVLDIDVDPAAAASDEVIDTGIDAGPVNYSVELAGGREAGQVRMIGPADRVTFANPEEVEGLRELGYEVEDLGGTIARAREEGLQDAFGGVGGQIEAAGRGVLRGASLGLSDVVIAGGDGDPVAQALLEANPLTSTVSEVAGAVVPGLLGAAPGAVGSLARLTPAGLTAARGAQFVARGGTLINRAGRAVLAGGFEGAAAEAGSYLGRQAIKDEAISADALASAILRGGALGGVAGGVFQAGGEAVADALAKLRARSSSQVADDLGRAVVGGADDLAPPLRYEDVLGGKIDDVDAARRAMLGEVDDALARNTVSEIDGIVSSPLFRNTTQSADGALAKKVTRRLNNAAAEFDRARSAARDWSSRWQRAVDAAPGEDTAAKVLAVPRELTDEGPVQLALLDEARAKLDDVLSTTRQRFLGEAPPVPPAPPPTPPSLRQRVQGAVESGLAGLETARDLGAPVPTLSGLLGGGGFGNAVGWFVRIKAGARALKKVGLLPSTPATRAASTVRATRKKLDDVLARPGAGALTSSKPPSPATMARYKALFKTVRAASLSDEVEAQAQADLSSLDPVTAMGAGATARRAIEYLASTAPKNPLERSPFADRWQPDPHSLSDFARRADTVADPVRAIELIMREPGRILEVQALRAVYPAMYAEVQAHIAVNADTLAKTLSEPQRQFLGYAFGVPLSITQMPGYGAPIQPAQPEPQPHFGSTPNARNSPVALTEEVTAGRSSPT